MNPFRFALSLRMTHPVRTASDIEDALSLKARVANTVDEPRRTPKGKRLEGVNQQTFCTFRLSEGDGEHLIEEVAQWNLKFLEKRDFFEGFVSSGGEIEYFLGVFLDGNSGFDLPPEELRKMGELRITLSLDIYP